MRRIGYPGSVALIFAAMSAHASPDNPLGFYVGAAAGRSDIRRTGPYSGLDLVARPTGWTVFAGLRPIPLAGVELQYIDYGQSTVQSQVSGLPDAGPRLETIDWQQRATMVSGLLYAPIPVRFLDIYGRAGLAQLDTRGTAAENIGCGFIARCPSYPPLVTGIRETDRRLSYGGGAQLKISSLAFRLEYQRISASRGDPDLLSLGLSWTF